MPSTFERSPGAWRAAFVLALGGVFAWLYLRGHGLYPAVFADEWYYSKMARLAPLGEALLPSYLYLWLFSASNACGAAFLACVRIGNLALYFAALPFFYLTARRHTTQALAQLLTLFAAAAPLNAYTMYFMPEASYWFGFCVLSWIVLAQDHWRLSQQAVASGLVLGAMSLVKVHALFLLPALCLYLLVAAWLQGAAWLGRGLASAIIATLALLAVKFGLGWLLAGDAGLSLLGPFYQGNVDSGSTSPRLALLGPVAVSAMGHLMALAVLLGLPLAILLHCLASGALARRSAPTGRLLAWTFLMLGSAAGLAVAYTASLAAGEASEGVRLHLRYYSFVFPLLWLVTAVSAAPHGMVPDGGARWLRWTVAVPVLMLVIAAAVSLPTYSLSVVDGPDIAAMNMRRTAGHVTVVLQAALLLAWAAGRGNAARLFVLCLLPVTILVAQDRIGSFAAGHRDGNPGDRAGALVLDTVPAAERGRVTLVGRAQDLPQLMRAQFHIDHADSVALTLGEGAPVSEHQLPPGHTWLLIMGVHPAPFATAVRRTDEFTLLRMAPRSAAATP
ncbi:hypothetical protein [Massilia arenae]|uniref:Glycosyltransferase RgtA/B/C/D-like domain-containing protein n=1 Tax=Massilia arenae TaxID=2603288 RepID=A0A5C7G1W7_9BURK|nr:hypothetical protein [Massilia arenae]TXF97910.1 hypothetical protein FVD38_18265 [Massilia arenae]